MQEKVIQTKVCKHCQSGFDITDKDLGFYEKVSPIFQDRKYSIPTPTLCPDCRHGLGYIYYKGGKVCKDSRKNGICGIEWKNEYDIV